MSEVLLASRIPLENYADVVGAGEIEELRALAKPLRGRSMEMINSTAVGGGVAEILNRLVPLAEELDLSIRWDVMRGAEEFFDVTSLFTMRSTASLTRPNARILTSFCRITSKTARRFRSMPNSWSSM